MGASERHKGENVRRSAVEGVFMVVCDVPVGDVEMRNGYPVT